MRDWDSQVADLGSAYKLAPQSLGLPQTVNFSARVSLLILRLREVSSLSVGNYIQFGRSHESDFHGITRFGSKICHRSVTCVTCDTRVTVGADWVEARHRAQHGHSNGAQNTLGDWCGDAHVWVGGMVGGLVVAGVSWGCGKSVVNLTKSSQCPC